MSSPVRRPGNRPSRRERVDTAYRYTLATGGFGVATAAAAVVALITAFSWGWVLLLAVLTAVSGLLLRNALR